MKGTRILGTLLGLALHAAGATADQAALDRAASLYHQARFDSSRSHLESLLAEAGWRRRDSLMLFQYLGMASSRLGKDSAAADRFGTLLDLDSLFQFPRNEDPGILRNFATAFERRRKRGVGPTPATVPAATHTGASPPASGTDGGEARPAAGAGLRQETRMAGPVPGAASESSFFASRNATALRDPLRVLDSEPAPKPMNLALGAIPLGGGWLVRQRTNHAVALGLLQGGGLLLSLYASEKQSAARRDPYGVEEGREMDAMVRWQWVQAISLSTAVGAYLFSVFASGGG